VKKERVNEKKRRKKVKTREKGEKRKRWKRGLKKKNSQGRSCSWLWGLPPWMGLD